MKKKENLSLNLCDICLKITSADRYDEVMQEIVKRAAEIFSLKGALIRLLDKKGDNTGSRILLWIERRLRLKRAPSFWTRAPLTVKLSWMGGS